jgi:hypothetical protein
MNKFGISFETVREPKYESSELHAHIQDLFSIRGRHKAPKAIINSILAYVHKWFDKSDSIKQLPYSWQRCDALFDDLKPQFIKVMN